MPGLARLLQRRHLLKLLCLCQKSLLNCPIRTRLYLPELRLQPPHAMDVLQRLRLLLVSLMETTSLSRLWEEHLLHHSRRDGLHVHLLENFGVTLVKLNNIFQPYTKTAIRLVPSRL